MLKYSSLVYHRRRTAAFQSHFPNKGLSKAEGINEAMDAVGPHFKFLLFKSNANYNALALGSCRMPSSRLFKVVFVTWASSGLIIDDGWIGGGG
jgi:hypothetical protein